ncbi:MAG: hypothetical protein ACXW08_00620 [Solirubrobacteraceae bacterium]
MLVDEVSVASIFWLLLAISKGNDWGWDSGPVLVLFAGSAALLACFVFVEQRISQPLIDLTLVAKRPFAQAHVCAVGVGVAMAPRAAPCSPRRSCQDAVSGCAPRSRSGP